MTAWRTKRPHWRSRLATNVAVCSVGLAISVTPTASTDDSIVPIVLKPENCIFRTVPTAKATPKSYKSVRCAACCRHASYAASNSLSVMAFVNTGPSDCNPDPGAVSNAPRLFRYFRTYCCADQKMTVASVANPMYLRSISVLFNRWVPIIFQVALKSIDIAA